MTIERFTTRELAGCYSRGGTAFLPAARVGDAVTGLRLWRGSWMDEEGSSCDTRNSDSEAG